MRWLLVPALLLAAALYASLDAGAGIGTWWRLRSELRSARAELVQSREQVARLRRELADLEADGFAVERAVREDLGLARPGETIVRTAPIGVSNPRFP